MAFGFLFSLFVLSSLRFPFYGSLWCADSFLWLSKIGLFKSILWSSFLCFGTMVKLYSIVEVFEIWVWVLCFFQLLNDEFINLSLQAVFGRYDRDMRGEIDLFEVREAVYGIGHVILRLILFPFSFIYFFILLFRRVIFFTSTLGESFLKILTRVFVSVFCFCVWNYFEENPKATRPSITSPFFLSTFLFSIFCIQQFCHKKGKHMFLLFFFFSFLIYFDHSDDYYH